MGTDFDVAGMRNKYGIADAYASPPRAATRLPTPVFFLRLGFGPLLWLWRQARKGQCDDAAWVRGSARVADIFEGVGGQLRIEGLGHARRLEEPAIFVANHMSTLETFILPGVIRPMRPVTFVVKRSLVEMPVFGPIMRSRAPVVVDRLNPRADLAETLREGAARLGNGISVIVFPQHSRSLEFNRNGFNSIGVKLARKTGAPIVPLALKTDAWGIGKKVRELARIRPAYTAHFKFGAPMRVAGNGRAEQEAICDFIESALTEWQKQEGVNRQ